MAQRRAAAERRSRVRVCAPHRVFRGCRSSRLGRLMRREREVDAEGGRREPPLGRRRSVQNAKQVTGQTTRGRAVRPGRSNSHSPIGVRCVNVPSGGDSIRWNAEAESASGGRKLLGKGRLPTVPPPQVRRPGGHRGYKRNKQTCPTGDATPDTRSGAPRKTTQKKNKERFLQIS